MTMENRTQALEFRGSAGEYFRIWFVNAVLTLLTLGLYSPWAKVRNRRYLYGNTYLFGSSFEYLADPWRILKGRLAAAAFLAAMANAGYYAPALSGAMLIALLFLTPWIIVRTMRFNLANTAYRNLRFGFDGQYARALAVFVGLPVLVALSAGAAYPYFVGRKKQFLIDHSRYGQTHFKLHAEARRFYRPYFMLSLALAAYLTVGALTVVGLSLDVRLLALLPVVLAVGLLAAVVPLTIGYAYLEAAITNLTFGQTVLQGYRFECELETFALLNLYLTNIFAIVFSFGLLTPWTIIRAQRYKLSRIRVQAPAGAALFAAGANDATAAVGEELGDLFDIDIGL